MTELIVFWRVVLTVADIKNRGFQTVRIVDEPLAATFGPPVFANGVSGLWLGLVSMRRQRILTRSVSEYLSRDFEITSLTLRASVPSVSENLSRDFR